MKKYLYLGGVLFISGVCLFAMVHFAVANYAVNMQGWSGPPGRFQQARHEMVLNVPYFLSIIFMISGLIFLFISEVKTMFKLLIGRKKQQSDNSVEK